MNTTRAPSPPRAAVPATATPTMPIASTTSTPPPMSSRPASARPKNSSSSIASSSASSHMPSASSNGKPRGATPSASRSSLKAALGEPDRPTRAASKDSLKQKMAKKPDDSHKQPSKSEEQLKALKSDFDGLRSHLTCKICDRLLYQPYTIACGHTYCYSCLCTWFVNNKTRKTCPDCRTAVTHPPAPAYIIRDMTSMFIARAELLPAGETVEQHKVWSQEEADIVQQDKDNTDRRNGGLFKACFRSQLPLGPPLHAIRDQDDGVDRCPVCSWELEDSECIQCGLLFDENGELTWTDSFNGFSDMDEMSEQDMESEDLDADMDMEDQDFDGLGPEGWGDYYPDEVNFTMQRFLGHGIPPQAAFARRRPLSHSEAGSRRLYSPSIISDMYTDDMDTVQEEEEEGMDEDSSMNDFIEDDEHEPESGTSQSGSSTLSRTPQPSSARPGFQARNRRVVESESSSTISSVAEEEEEDDEEDQGPIRRGQRNRAQTRILNRANGSQESSGPPSSTSTDASMDELDEETQALLQAEGWFQHNEMDEQGEDDEDDGSDGGRTTVGWDATAISNDRIRMGGSLTPTADRPRPNTTIRPPSRAGSPLRQRPSLLPSAHLNYEDGEADDDDSDPDHDGDINMAMRALRSRRSRAQIRNAATFRASDYRLPNRGNSQGAEQDDHSDTSESGDHRRPRQEYNPRISRLFADHQRALMELQRGGPLLDLEPRSITPITRPRTSNRNRPSPAQAYSPFMAPAPARLRTPNMNHSSNTAANLRSPASPPRRNAPPSSLLETIADANTSAQNHSAASSVSSGSVVPTPSTSSASSRASTVAPDAAPNAPVEAGDRPPSRVSARPPSATGRRTPGFSPVYANFPHTNVGLNIQGRIFPHQVMGNPWGAFVQPRNVRTRSSRQVLREQSSTATLRAPNSRINLREGLTSPQGVRPQPSRVELRSQPSRRRLNPQNSTRTLRASEHNRPPQSPVVPSPTTSSAPRPSRLTQEETSARARELVNNRLQALGQSNAAPSRNNPFVQGFRRPTTASASPANPAPAAGSQHMRSSSNESNQSGSSHATAPPSPGLARRRSSRHMAATASGALSQPLGAYQAPAGAYNNNYFRSRQNSIGSIGSSAFDVPLDGNARGISPMMVTSLI